MPIASRRSAGRRGTLAAVARGRRLISQGEADAVVHRVPSSAYNRDEGAFPRVQLAGKDWRDEPT